MNANGRIRIGTSGWIYRHWRGVFYPRELPVKRWFAFYAEHFDTVEINNTFYRLPSESAFAAWRKQAPNDFLYAIKASRFLTHMKKLRDAQAPLANVLGRARRLGPRLGPILYQLPPRWHADAARLRQFIELLPANLNHVFEFRNPSWCNDEIRELLTAAGMSYCVHDMRGFECPRWLTGPVGYVRFHGPAEPKYSGRYSESHLGAWAEQIQQWSADGHDVYVYFNNDAQGHAVTNARELLTLVGATPALSPR